MQLALGTLSRDGRMGDAADTLAVGFAERQRLVEKTTWDALEKKYKA